MIGEGTQCQPTIFCLQTIMERNEHLKTHINHMSTQIFYIHLHVQGCTSQTAHICLRTTLRGLCSPYTIEVPRTKFRYSGFVTLLLTSEPYCWHQSLKKTDTWTTKWRTKHTTKSNSLMCSASPYTTII